jgi:hypothetical protein
MKYKKNLVTMTVAIAIAALLVGSVLTMYTAEAKSKSGKIKVGFGDARGYQGTGKIKIWNIKQDITLVKSKIDFSKLNPSADCFCKTFSFKWKGSHIGDKIALKVTAGGGSWEDASGSYQLEKGTTRASISLDEIGE